ncbi:auxin response factor 16-like [Tripterygium wilfordii]|uniref:auxin response factor 16-like n=1 Tax=Tripterygium wilfordii TaxID=458696 RepID=UPI0018F81D70|nr:auxin response factor 16-like [Tripterygium wilfordii]
MGTITGISDHDPIRWKNSQRRNLQVGWDESAASLWEIEPVTAPFFICQPPFFRSKRPKRPGMPAKPIPCKLNAAQIHALCVPYLGLFCKTFLEQIFHTNYAL